MDEDQKEIIEATAKGVTGAIIEKVPQKIEELIRKFKHKELLFIEDEDTVNVVIEQRKKPEFSLYKLYTKDTDLLLQMEMGFSLRRLDRDGKVDKLQRLRAFIKTKYGEVGLHIAQLVQGGAFLHYLIILFGSSGSQKELEEAILTILNDIEKYVVFVQAYSDVNLAADSLVTRINSNLPRAVIICSYGDEATKKAETIFVKTRGRIENYRFETQVHTFETRSDQNIFKNSQKYFFLLKNPSI